MLNHLRLVQQVWILLKERHGHGILPPHDLEYWITEDSDKMITEDGDYIVWQKD